MSQNELMDRLHHLKNNVQHLWGKFADKQKEEVSPDQIHIDNYQYESHRIDDMPLTLNKDPGPGIRYDYTENSEFARGAEKSEAIGIDRFGDGDDDSFIPEDSEEYDYRHRKNFDLH